MKVFKKVLLTAIALTAIFSFSGCSLIDALKQNGAIDAPTTDYVSSTEINADNLMAARNKIRQFNVSVDTQYYSQSGWFSRLEGTGLGSGVVFEEDNDYYYALTNYHVVTNTMDGIKYTTAYTVKDIYGTEYTGASVVLEDNIDNDIAVIRFPKKAAATYTLPKVNYTARLNTNVALGEFVLAVGNPSGVNNIVTYGKIVGWAKINNVSFNVINHTALINPGNSGGALCDIEGNLLGLNTWGTDGADDDNFSISLTQINRFIQQFQSTYLSKAA